MRYPPTARSGMLAAVLSAAVACSPAQGSIEGTNGGASVNARPDAGAVGRDIPGLDTPSPTDTGTPPTDTGTPPADTGTRPTDAGSNPGTDAHADTGGMSGTDSGSPVDTGSTGVLPVPVDTVAYTGSLPSGAGQHSTQLTVAGTARDVEVYLPAHLAAHPALLVMFHGTNEDGPTMMANSNVQGVADTQGFIAIAPSALDRDADWDHTDPARYWVTYPSTDPNTNPDLLLARAVIAAAIRTYAVDPDRVYALGHSNGGFFTLMTAMVLRDRIAAFAENSSGLVRCAMTLDCGFQAPDGPDTCAAIMAMPGWCGCTGPEKPVSIPTTPGRMPPAYMGHGTADPLVSVYYTCQLEARLRGLGYTTETHLRIGDGHALPETFVADAWPFLSSHRRQ